MSSLETLLEAAKFVECTDVDMNENSARAPDPPEFHHYAKPAPTQKRSNSESDKSDTNDEGRSGKKQAGAGTREVHNKLEKNRRAHLKECFDNLKQQVPSLENHNKVSNLSILRGAYKYIMVLKRREADLQQELDQVTCDNLASHVRLSVLQKELADMNLDVDISNFIPPQDEDTRSVSTATAHNESPIMSDVEEEVEISTTSLPQSNTRQLTFSNIIVSSPAKQPLSVGGLTIPAQSLGKTPVFAIPLKTVKGAHTTGNVGTNHKTIAAMLNTSGQSLLCENLGGTKLGVSVNNRTPTKSSTAPQQQYPVSLLHAGSLSLVANQQSTTVTSVANTNQAQIKISAKNPVNQILQKTIAQRVQLQQLQKLQQEQQQQQQAPATLLFGTNQTTIQSPTITVTQAAGSGPQVITVNASAMRPMVSTLKTLPPMQAIALNQVLPSAFALGANQALLPSTVSSPSASVNSQAITIATINKLAGSTATTPSSVTLSTARNATLINQLAGLANTNSAQPTPTITSLSGLNLANVKPILTLPINQIAGAQLVSQQVTTLQQLLSQAAANKTAQIQGASLVATPSSSSDTVSGPTIITPAIPVTQVGQVTGNLSQFLPINVVAQGASQGPTLNTNISNTALNAQVLKSLGLPILQHSFSLPVKPLVMVSMGNVVSTTGTTSNTQTIHLNLPVSQS